ncbi:MAG: glycosyltransferase family 2 protein [Thermoproteota archaeon]|nr:glycosyltransferase family 2 protein [Thermoproteota archaeon]
MLSSSRIKPLLSIVIPTYNEADNIVALLESVKAKLGNSISAEIIVVDDNSPDGTGKLVDQYIERQDTLIDKTQANVRIIHRMRKEGLIQAVLQGINSSQGNQILIMDADFSHPPEILPVIVKKIKENGNCIIVASRYVKGGAVKGWPLKRRVISWFANSLARLLLNINNIKDPMSGYFVLPKKTIEKIKFNTRGYKILLELLVKDKDSCVVEIPYTFTDRKSGKSKFNYVTMLDYVYSIWKLYLHGKKDRINYLYEKNSIKFLSKAGRFFTVGVSGLLVNYLVSICLSSGFVANFSYLQSTSIGILTSITTNFIFNKFWTFEDRNYSPRHLAKQYLLFLLISSLGASIQLSLVYYLTETRLPYELSLVISVLVAAVGNFILNKRFTFGEKVWG